MPDGGNPFFVISETNQPLCSVRVGNTDLLSVGREYRFTVFDHRVEDTDLLYFREILNLVEQCDILF